MIVVSGFNGFCQTFTFTVQVDKEVIASVAKSQISELMKKQNLENTRLGEPQIFYKDGSVEITIDITRKEKTFFGEITVAGELKSLYRVPARHRHARAGWRLAGRDHRFAGLGHPAQHECGQWPGRARPSAGQRRRGRTRERAAVRRIGVAARSAASIGAHERERAPSCARSSPSPSAPCRRGTGSGRQTSPCRPARTRPRRLIYLYLNW